MRTFLVILALSVALAAAVDVAAYKNARAVAQMRKSGKEVLPVAKHAIREADGYDYGYYGYGYGPYDDVDVPDGWTCVPSYYDSLDGCDCNCGIYDPDCNVDGQSIFGCFADDGFQAVCVEPGTCEFVEVDIPEEWTCNPAFYDTNDGCDCNCGLLDPDCLISEQFVFNCNAGVDPTCVAPGVCEYALPVPTGWVCPVSFYGTADGCDCNCGRPDPDCSLGADEGGAILNCPCDDMTCSTDAGFCEGQCNGFIISALTIAESTAPPITVCDPFVIVDNDDDDDVGQIIVSSADDDECDCSQCPLADGLVVSNADDDDDASSSATTVAVSLVASAMSAVALL